METKTRLYPHPMGQWLYHIPSISVGNEKTAAFVVTVNTINLEEDSEAKDIKGPIDAPITLSEVLPYLIAAIIIGLLIYLLLRYLKKR